MAQVSLIKPRELHHIAVIESHGTNCAWVRMNYNGKNVQKSFPFRKYGGKYPALAEAKKFRDEEGCKMYGDNWPFAKFAPRKLSPLNSSGVIGVSYAEKDHAWVATWQQGQGKDRHQKNAYFSIEKYGNQKAKRKAVLERNRKVLENKMVAA